MRFLAIIFVLISSFCFAQKKTKVFYDEWGNVCKEEDALYYENVTWGNEQKRLPETSNQYTYFIADDSVHSVTPLIKMKESGIAHRFGGTLYEKTYYGLIPHGFQYKFYPNGSAKSEIYFYYSYQMGIAKWWYPDGKLKEIGKYYPEEKQRKLIKSMSYLNGSNYKIENFWDSLGNQTVINGNGKKRKFGLRRQFKSCRAL